MELNQKLRPRIPVEHEVEKDKRTKCNACCGLYCASHLFVFSFAVTAPCQFVAFKYIGAAPVKGLVGFMDRYFFVPLPLAASCFVHQCIMSQALWSPRKRPVYDIHWMVAGISIGIQFGCIAVATAVSRLFLQRYSRAYRLKQWDYERLRRNANLKMLPSVGGMMTENFDWVQACWMVMFYHMFWGGAVTGSDAALKSRYALWYRGMDYSKHCSPRWREWREQEILTKTDKEWQPLPTSRWGSIFVMDEWRDRH
jgi:hypothetical protein